MLKTTKRHYSHCNSMRRLSSPLLIIAYGIFLVLMYLWGHQYYLTDTVLVWWLFCYVPYVLGGAFLLCFFVARLVVFTRESTKIWKFFSYLLLLLLLVYIPEGFLQALTSSYDNGYTALFRDWSAWMEPLFKESGEARIILIESALGFSLGSFLQMRKEKKKQKDSKQSQGEVLKY